MKDRYIPDVVRLHELVWLAAGIVLTVLPHGLRMPGWILLLTLALVLWRLAGACRNWPLPDQKHTTLRVVQIGIMIGAFIGVYLSFHTIVGREAGSALLVMLAGFKFLETRHERDFYIATFLGFFVIITNFFVTETILTAIYTLLTLLVLFTALVTFNDRKRKLHPVSRIKTAGNLILQAIPVMLVLFVLFPRIEGPLWGLPEDAHTGKLGIDDEMEPGSVSRLIQSGEVAFRVDFDGTPPKNSKLYWRGPVLWYNDGRKWSREKINDKRRDTVIETFGEPVNYTITLEPTSQRWLFALEMPERPARNSYFSIDHQLLTRKSVNKRIRYQLSSYTNYQLGSSNNYELQRGLQLPAGFHPRTIRLAQSWRTREPGPEKIIERALNMFNQENFYYTLTPPLLSGDNVDDFLFNTRQGFCEHYAGAFAVLMRAAGIPARVVMGYQGGRLNPLGDYFIIQQRDAHAWVEVWLEDRGWMRVDPTSAVSPARVEEGIGGALPDALIDVPAIFSMNQFSRHFWQNLRNTWDAINNQWIQWVITYGPDQQALFLKKFGIQNIGLHSLIILLVIIVCSMFVVIAIWMFRQHQPDRDPARVIYDQFCRKLALIGYSRLPYEGPLDFSNRIASTRQSVAENVEEITRLYISIRYGDKNGNTGLLKEKVRAFRPEKTVKRKQR